MSRSKGTRKQRGRRNSSMISKALWAAIFVFRVGGGASNQRLGHPRRDQQTNNALWCIGCRFHGIALASSLDADADAGCAAIPPIVT